MCYTIPCPAELLFRRSISLSRPLLPSLRQFSDLSSPRMYWMYWTFEGWAVVSVIMIPLAIARTRVSELLRPRLCHGPVGGGGGDVGKIISWTSRHRQKSGFLDWTSLTSALSPPPFSIPRSRVIPRYVQNSWLIWDMFAFWCILFFPFSFL